MNEESLFQQALELPIDQRAAFLERECPDPVLRARVEALLAADATSHWPTHGADTPTHSHGLKLDHDPADRSAYRPAQALEAEGAIIAGRYKLRQKIGEGGMGSVWMADQLEPVKRKVAVKLIRAERGQSRTILARFEAERQAIALMDHPHIAKLLDAGTTEAGVPFFVMELVKGIPLHDYCDQHRLTIPERLNLFVQICGAVQHAHQKGIIHRDLKPSNILVENHDGKPVPKVIDFGLAKATTGLQLSEQSLFTGFGMVLGTPLYMAPEQASFNAIDVDTRADIYSLGVILYELLTGTTPITRETLKKAALDEMLQLVREQEAPTPSSRLSSSDSMPSVAANRQIEPGKLSRFVKGELDWIVMKALAKERERRYETASSFAKDIERFLNHEPVSAGPPSATYRLRKFVRRNRPQVVAASLVLLALVAGVIGTTWGLLEARKQAEIARAEAAEKERQRALAVANAQRAQREKENAEKAAAAEKLARQAEERERKFAEAIAQFVRDDFLGLTSVEGQDRFAGEFSNTGLDRNATLMTLLDRAAEKLKTRKDLAPRIEAELCWIVGVNYRGAGEAAKGVPFLERAVGLRRQVLGPDDADTLIAMNSLAVCYSAVGNGDLALPLYEETLKLRKAKLGADHPDTLSSMSNLALGYQEAGRLDVAVRLLEETLKLRKDKLGADHPDTLNSMSHLAGGYQAAGKLDMALPLFEETLRLMKAKLGPDHPDTLACMNNLALGYRDAGKLELALPLFEETVKLMKAKLGADHPYTLTSMANLATGYHFAGRLDLALPLHEETFRLMKAKLGPDHPDTLTSMNILASGYHAAGRLDLALPLLEETLKLRKAKLGVDHPDTLTSMNNLAEGYADSGDLERALLLHEEAQRLMKAKLGADHPLTLASMGNLARVYRATGKLELALPLLEETLSHRTARLGRDHPDTITSVIDLGEGFRDAGKLELALPLWEEALMRCATLGLEHPGKLRTMNNLAGGYLATGKLDQAVSLYEETLKLTMATLGADHPETLDIMNNLATSYWFAKRLDMSVPLFEELLLTEQEKLGRAHPFTQRTVANLGVNYKDAGRVAEAIPLLEEAYLSAKKFPELRRFGLPLLDAYRKAGKTEEAARLIHDLLTDARTQYPKDSPELADQLAQFGRMLIQMKVYAEAEPLLRECLAICEKTPGPDDPGSGWLVFNTMSMLGETLLVKAGSLSDPSEKAMRLAEAELLLVKGYEGMRARERTPGAEAARIGLQQHIPEALDRLIQLYTALDKPDEVKKYQNLRAMYPSAKDENK